MIRRCPLCKSQESSKEILPEVEVTDSTLASHWSGFLTEKIFFPYHRCACGFLFCPHYLDDKVITQLYGSMTDNEHSGNPKLEQATKAGYAKQFLNYSKRQHFKSILELGADNGTLARILNESVIIDQYHCVEPNQEVHDQLRLIPNVVIHETLEQALKAGKKFDAVLAVHVMDHIPNFDLIMTKLRDAMCEGSVFYCVVHNEKSLLAKIFRRRWPAYCLQHPHLFNHVTRPKILDKKYYTSLKIYRTQNYFSFGYLFEHLCLALFKKTFVFPEMFNVRVALGNIALIGVRKND